MPGHAVRHLGRAAPTAGEMDLLRAALLTGDAGSEAWRRWRSAHTVEFSPWRDHEVFPAVGANLSREVLGSDAAAIQGFRRRTWADNQRHLAALAGAIEVLDGAGADPVVVKGASLISSVYDDQSVRPMGDVDVLVPPDRYADARRVLAGVGWVERAPKDFGDYLHGVGMERGEGTPLDLHRWTMFPRYTRSGEEGMLGRAVPHEVVGVRCRRLALADEFVFDVVHGLRSNSTSTVRWPLDASQIIRFSEVDGSSERLWADVVRVAGELGVAPVVRDGLRLLRDEFGQPIPDGVLASLSGSSDLVLGLEWWACRRFDLQRWRARRFFDAERRLHGSVRWRRYLEIRYGRLQRSGWRNAVNTKVGKARAATFQRATRRSSPS